MKKYLLLSLILVLGLAGLAAANYPPQVAPVYPSAYWVKGILQPSADGASGISGYKVIVYKESGNPASAYAYYTTGADGKFFINPYDDQRFNLQPGTYYIGVVAQTIGGKSYGVGGVGADEKSITISDADDGYLLVAPVDFLTLTEGKGIVDPEGGLAITSAALPDGTVNTLYNAPNGFDFTAAGGRAPYNWSLDIGSTLPPGLTLNQAGKLSGTPTQIGSFSFTIKVTDAANLSVTKVVSLNIKAAPGDGPVITVKVLLQGLYDQAKDTQIPTTIALELRSGASVSQANSLQGYCEITLDGTGQGTNNGNWTPLPALPVDGQNYYIVIKQKHPGVPAGMSHLPIITSKTFNISKAVPQILDFTSGTDIYDEHATDPTKVPAMATLGAKKAMWAGDMNGDGYVNVIDVGEAWYYLFTNYNNKVAENALADPKYKAYGIADLDGNTLVNVIDVGNPWFAAFSVLKDYTSGPHTYVPPIQ